MSRPNFLIVTTDQQRPDTLGCDNPAIRTPTLDALAARGIVFQRGYTVNAVCTPARASLLTGHYPSRHGAYMVGTALPDGYGPTIPDVFSQNGYFTALLGKTHFKQCLDETSFECHPNTQNREFFRSWDGPYYGFEHVRLTIRHSCEGYADAMHYGVWLEDQGVDIGRYFGYQDYQGWGAWELDEKYHQSQWVADETISAIDKAAGREEPFFFWTSFTDPHNPCYVPEPWASMYDPDDMPFYSATPGEMDDKPPFYAAFAAGSNEGGDPAIGVGDVRGLPEMDERKSRERIAAYYGMISLMDHHLGRIVRHLEEKGILDDTVIVFTTDHGECTGNHGLWGKGLPAYEDVQRVPFVVSAPDCATPGAHSTALQSIVDIGATCLSLAGIEIPAFDQGVDQTAAWRDAAARVRDWAMLEFRPDDGPFIQHTYIEDRWKLVVYHDRPYGELYDMHGDPEQMRNLWDDPEHAETRLALLQRYISAGMEKDGKLLPRTAFA
jgi:arylsulfatase A-like enzyme